MNAAFADYAVPMQLTPAAFAMMMQARGLNMGLSRLAIIDGEIAAFWLVGARGTRAYLISSGTVPLHRRQGLSQQLGQSVIANLTLQGFVTLQSEVLENNPGARALYCALGFAEVRTLECYTRPMAAASTMVEGAVQADITAICADLLSLCDSTPSWQNDTPSLINIAETVSCFAIRDQSGLVAFAAFVPRQANLAQIAVRSDMRRRGLATQLLDFGQRTLGIDNLRVINVDHADAGLAAFLRSAGAQPTVSQKELKLAF